MKTVNTVDEFNNCISDGKVLVDFSAEWCGPCKMLNEVLKQVDEENVIDIVQVDVDRVRGLAKIYRIFSVPTVMIFEDGKLINEKKGFMTKPELMEYINESK